MYGKRGHGKVAADEASKAAVDAASIIVPELGKARHTENRAEQGQEQTLAREMERGLHGEPEARQPARG